MFVRCRLLQTLTDCPFFRSTGDCILPVFVISSFGSTLQSSNLISATIIEHNMDIYLYLQQMNVEKVQELKFVDSFVDLSSYNKRLTPIFCGQRSNVPSVMAL